MSQAATGRFLGVSEQRARRMMAGEANIPVAYVLLLLSMIAVGEDGDNYEPATRTLHDPAAIQAGRQVAGHVPSRRRPISWPSSAAMARKRLTGELLQDRPQPPCRAWSPPPPASDCQAACPAPSWQRHPGYVERSADAPSRPAQRTSGGVWVAWPGLLSYRQKSLNLPGDNSVYRTVCWMLRWPR